MKTLKWGIIPILLITISLGMKDHTTEKEQSALFEKAEFLKEGMRGFVDPRDVETGTLTVEANLRNFKTEKSYMKVTKAFELLEYVMNSEEFKKRVVNFMYKGKREFRTNKGLTNEEIYHKIMEGAEVLSPDPNMTMDLDLTLYRSSWWGRKTVGYTKPSTKRIWMNTRHFYKFNPAQVAGNISHEWCHKLGFKHKKKYNSRRKYTVPYGVGYIVKELGEMYLNGEYFE